MSTAAIIGGGVIGGGWAARFLLNGWNVRVFDPDPEAERKISEVLANARRSLPGLSDAPLPPEGQLSFHADLAEALAGAAWVQESVPERLDIKHRVMADIQASCAADAVIGSSTSGFKPSELQEGAARPEQIMVAHPFNPVYLLPLVELVTTPTNTAPMIARAQEILTQIGMYPLHLKKEIDAHVADRFLEAVWREALWLVKDGIATTEEIDNAIRYGFGIRWAQMGLFETYRVAGGEAGMKHFMAQFGPALEWPWTKLMDVPEFTDELVDLIAGQSDAQSGAYSIRELERIRDDNLVGMMRALKANAWGAGALLQGHDAMLKPAAGLSGGVEEIGDLSQPILTLARAVPLDWTDYNGHMTESRYLDAFAQSTDRFMEIIGCDADYIASGGSYFTAETHIRHLDEALAGDRISVRTQLLLGQGKKLHLFHRMYKGDTLIATGEHFLLHVSLETRKPSAPSDAIEAAMARITTAQAALPYPEGAGSAIRTAGMSARVLITAGASGVGHAMATGFAAQGDRVWVADVDEAALASCPDGWQRTQVDASDEAGVAGHFADIEARWGGLDVLCANAGIAGPTAPVEDVALEDWHRCLAVNLDGAFLAAKYAAPLMKAAGQGAMILTSSTAGQYGYPNRAPYAAAKWAVIGLMKTLAMELGPHGVRANAICPGAVEGPRMEGVLTREADAKGMTRDQVYAGYASGTAMGRFIEAEDVAAMAVFLASDAARLVSGQVIAVDGFTVNPDPKL